MMISRIKSPMGFYYKIDSKAPSGERLARRKSDSGPFSVGQPEFSIQAMSADELVHIAQLMRAESSGR
jgi:hypothetical protein